MPLSAPPITLSPSILCRSNRFAQPSVKCILFTLGNRAVRVTMEHVEDHGFCSVFDAANRIDPITDMQA
jgi:hypothetical protein